MQLAPEKITPISHLTVGYPLIYPLALLFKIFGISILKARVLMVFFIMSLVLISYLAIKKRYGLNQSLLSIALLVTFPPLYGNGKSVLGEVPGLFG